MKQIVQRLLLSAAVLSTLALPSVAAPKRKHAKNVILFLADAGGLPTISAASLYGYNAPLKLYIESWDHTGLSDTTPIEKWVTDSAAGMTAIVTGQKARNGVISEGPNAIPRKSEDAPVKTILEYAEEHGLATGVITNVSLADATPAACYAHVNDRSKWGEIFLQMFEPRFGDGVDIAFGAGRKQIFSKVKALGKDPDQVAEAHQRKIYSSLDEVPADAKRAIAILDEETDVPVATEKAIHALSQNSKGYFLMVEWDSHTDNPEQGLSHVVNLDKMIRKIASEVNLNDTLLLFTADHSFNLRVIGGGPDKPLLSGEDTALTDPNGKKAEIHLPAIHVGHQHSGEPVLAAAQGASADLVHGIFPNSHWFEILMQAYGWKASPEPVTSGTKSPAAGQ